MLLEQRSPDRAAAEETGGAKLKFDFLPNNYLAQESFIQGKRADQMSTESVTRRELSMGKIAEVCQLDVDLTHQVMQQIVKQIVS